MWLLVERARVCWCLSLLGVTVLLSPCLRVYLSLLAMDHRDLSLWKLALRAIRFDPLIVVRGVLRGPAPLDAHAFE